MAVEGLYLSSYQDITQASIDKLLAKNVRFIGIRLTQGGTFVDRKWEYNASLLRHTDEIYLFPWHFVTNEDAGKQYANFIAQVNKFDRWRLPPALDCEAYASASGEAYNLAQIQTTNIARRHLMYNDSVDEDGGNVHISILPNTGDLVVWKTYALSYPTEAIVDAIGRKLTAWMATQPAIAKYLYPAIYTNCGSGNVIFHAKSMSRYPLWVANWNTPGKPPLTQPCKPAVWKDEPWYIWQDGIVPGEPYGVDGQVDHDVWGSLFEFPGDAPTPPPPPVGNTIEVTVKDGGSIWTGTIKETGNG